MADSEGSGEAERRRGDRRRAPAPPLPPERERRRGERRAGEDPEDPGTGS